jgi:hypothetical protein
MFSVISKSLLEYAKDSLYLIDQKYLENKLQMALISKKNALTYKRPTTNIALNQFNQTYYWLAQYSKKPLIESKYWVLTTVMLSDFKSESTKEQARLKVVLFPSCNDQINKIV